MRRLIAAASLFLVAALSGCATDEHYRPPAGDKVQITQETYDGLQQYLQLVGSSRPGAFAVSTTGRGYSAYYCEGYRCRSEGSSYSQAALKDCERYGNTCYILARSGEIEYEYKIVN